MFGIFFEEEKKCSSDTDRFDVNFSAKHELYGQIQETTKFHSQLQTLSGKYKDTKKN